MNRRAFLLLATLVSLFLGAQIAAAQETADIFGRVNNLRASRGIPGYTLNGALSAAAQSQAQWIVDSGSVSHTRPDGSGPRQRAAAAGYASAQVSENIYGGTNASANDAWTFWVNSGVHLAGLISTNYSEVGVGVARGSWGAAYVMVFGNPGGVSLAVAAAAGAGAGNSGGGGANAAPAAPVSFMGIDENGNIQHLVQPGDTLGDIALIYGYTWDDLPAMMALNGLSNVRDLVPGSIFLVQSSRATIAAAAEPTADNSTPAPTLPPTDIPPSITPFMLPTSTPLVITASAATPTPLPAAIVELTVVFTPLPSTLEGAVAIVPTPISTQDSQLVAAVPTAAELRDVQANPPASPDQNSPSTWLMIALGVQVLIVIGAGFEFIRRALRRR